MTTSLRRIAECVDKTGAVSIKDDLLPVAQTALPGIPAIDLPADGSISALRLMRHLEWFWCRGDCVFQKMPVPTRFRSPSGEEAQILLDGIAERVSLFMGSSDDELDWHIYPRLDEATKAALREVGPLEDDKLWCEWMASDHSHDETLGRQWWSSDMDNVLMLRQLPDQRARPRPNTGVWSRTTTRAAAVRPSHRSTMPRPAAIPASSVAASTCRALS